MNDAQNTNRRKFDLEERTTEFAKQVVRLCKTFPQNSINSRINGQVVGSAGSIGANYREANDALGKKDFTHRLKISRKEAKETIYWLELAKESNPESGIQIDPLIQEASELKNILSAIIIKSQ